MVTREPEEGSPSFFKVIRYPSAVHLSLPNAFVRRYLEKIPKNPTLVTATGEHSWKMEFVKIGENYCFAHGWEELVKDVGLCIRDVVVFWLVDPVTFLVTFLGENGCEKGVPVNKVKTNDDVVGKDGGEDGVGGDCHDDDDDDDGECHHDDDDGDKNLCFQKVYGGKSFRYYMSMPLNFVKAAGLEHKQSLKLKDHEGKEWMMRITVQRYKGVKYGLSTGWSMFHRYHRFSEGDILTFMFDKQEGVLNLTQVFKSKRPIKQENEMDEVKGSQSRYGYGKIKIEDECSPTDKPCGGGGGVKVKTECESGSKGYASVKIEDDWAPEMVARKRKRDTPPPEKPSRGGGVAVNTEPGLESVFRSKHVVYF